MQVPAQLHQPGRQPGGHGAELAAGVVETGIIRHGACFQRKNIEAGVTKTEGCATVRMKFSSS
jgi:hypothetical protein